jgi:hypothetical protein
MDIDHGSKCEELGGGLSRQTPLSGSGGHTMAELEKAARGTCGACGHFFRIDPYLRVEMTHIS